MKTTITINDDGSIFTENYVLEQVMDTLKQFGINTDDEKNDNLIKKLTIEKLEYARYCLAVYTAKQTCDIKNFELYEIIDKPIADAIISLGSSPIERIFAS